MKTLERLSLLLAALIFLSVGCKKSAVEPTVVRAETSAPSSSATSGQAANSSSEPMTHTPEPHSSEAMNYGSVPTMETGLSVDQAYAAIPHPRTVWRDFDSTASDAEKAYLKTIFDVIDQGTIVRVQGMQNFANSRFDSPDPVQQYDQLIDFARNMTPPKNLENYHNVILQAFTNQRQFFVDWKADREQFRFQRSIAAHPGVQRSDSALHAAYEELLRKYPSDSANNKEAFFNYHCAFDFL